MASHRSQGGANSGSALTFTEPRLEEVYLVYTAEKNRGLTLRLHYMVAAAWAVGCVKTLAQAALALRARDAATLPQYSLLLLAQLVNLGCRLSAMPRLQSTARQDQLQQERTKAWLHVLLDVAVMVCVILSDPALPHSPAPLSAMVVTSFLAVLDMVRRRVAACAHPALAGVPSGSRRAPHLRCTLAVACPGEQMRLDTLLRLHAIKWLCFLFLEADRCLRAPVHSLQSAGDDVLHAALLGTLLPFIFAVVSEASQREAFLRDCKRPLDNLGPFWSGACSLLRKLPLRPALPVQLQDPHVD
eukprot:scaffold6.g2798.t1